MIQSLSRYNDKLLVATDTQPEIAVELWGEHSWDTLRTWQRMRAWEDWLASIGATQDRVWWWPVRYSAPIYRVRRRHHVEWLVKHNIVPQVMVFQRYRWGSTSRFDPLTWSPVYEHFIDEVMEDLAGLPYILEIGNELSYAAFMRGATKYVKSLDPDQLVAINTNKLGETGHLVTVGADIVAMVEGWMPSGSEIVQIDTDHYKKPAKPSDDIQAFEDGEAAGASSYLVMRAWCDPDDPEECSALEQNTSPVNDPHHPRWAVNRGWLTKHVGNQLGETQPPPPGPPPPAPPPSGVVTRDLTEFFVPGPSLIGYRLGNHSFYIDPSTIIWTKDSAGNATEGMELRPDGIYQSWTPHNKWKDRDWKGQLGGQLTALMAPRSISYDPSQPHGKLWEHVDLYGYPYHLVEDCVVTAELSLAGSMFELWGPTTAEAEGIGGIVPDNTETLVVAHYWGSPNFPYPVKEVWILGRLYGLMLWRRFRWDGSQYVLDVQSQPNNTLNGPAVAPIMPCIPEVV